MKFFYHSRLYTQNIDNLEALAGIKSEKLIEAHGTFNTAKCVECENYYSGSFVEVNFTNISFKKSIILWFHYLKKAVLEDKIPHCEDCRGIVKPVKTKIKNLIKF